MVNSQSPIQILNELAGIFERSMENRDIDGLEKGLILFQMADFIELTLTSGKSVLINIDCIAYIDTYSNGSVKIHICTTHIQSSERGGCAEVINVKESYQVIKNKIYQL